MKLNKQHLNLSSIRVCIYVYNFEYVCMSIRVDVIFFIVFKTRNTKSRPTSIFVYLRPDNDIGGNSIG